MRSSSLCGLTDKGNFTSQLREQNRLRLSLPAEIFYSISVSTGFTSMWELSVVISLIDVGQ